MWQTLLLNRIPYEGEVKEATAKEYTRRMAECSKSPVDYSKDIEQLQASTSEVGGRLTQLEQTIRQLILSLGEKVPQEDVIMSAPVGTLCTLTDDVAGDVARAQDVHGDISGDAANVVIRPRDVVNESAEDVETEVDYLVDSISDDVVKEAEAVVLDDGQGVDAQRDSTVGLTSLANRSPRDGNMASQVVSDPYSMGVKSAAASPVAETLGAEVCIASPHVYFLNTGALLFMSSGTSESALFYYCSDFLYYIV